MTTPALARIKRAVRVAISRCGGVDGAGATAGRCRSVAGDWNNLNSPAFPPADCALALADGEVNGLEPAEIEAEANDLIERAALIRQFARQRQGELGVGK